jgi:hypothetical protein
MNFSRRYNTGIPQLKERLHEFLRTKDLTGQVENEFQTENAATGWTILTVDTSDPKLLNELDGFISNLERIAMRKSTLPVSTNMVWSLKNTPKSATTGHQGENEKFHPVTGLSILRLFLYCPKLRITSGKKLFTTQHEVFQADATTREMFALLGWGTKTCHSASNRGAADT